jgi:glycosyltransferase involved in cell wall biosynthesis
MLKVLYAAGFRFVVCETRDTWKPIAAQPDPARVIAMPTPIPDYLVRQTPLRQGAERKMVIGFIGSFRAEKSPLWALDQVAKAQDEGRFVPGIELLIGTADTDFLQRWEGRALLIDTTARADYLRALEACDVVVLPYEEASYSYRVSGVLAEAVALGCLVVAPDLPTLRDQVLLPLPVGVCYKDRLELVDCVQRAIVMAGQPSSVLASQAHREIRSLDAVVDAIALMGAS